MAGIYVHVPFCHAKCAYCDFYSGLSPRQAERFVDAIVAEYILRRNELPSSPTTVYIGGGTPSILPPDLFARLIQGLQLKMPMSEFTVEANPEDVTEDRVRAWIGAGVDRVSMGVQSLVDSELVAVGRRHSAQEAVNAYRTLRRCGVGNISLDLIYGLPGQTLESWYYSLSKLLELRPDHLSAYILSYEPGTRLSALLRAGKISQAPDELIEQMYDLLLSATRAAGYNHYEISNFALPDCQARHNSSYWDSTPYLGLGPSAHSFDGRLRRFNPPSLRLWLEKIEQGEVAFQVDEEDDGNRFDDLLITALRTARGLSLETLDADRRRRLLRDAEPFLKQGQLELAGTTLRIPERHWLLSDAILRELMQGN